LEKKFQSAAIDGKARDVRCFHCDELEVGRAVASVWLSFKGAFHDEVGSVRNNVKASRI
jgi:hypothetical protein